MYVLNRMVDAARPILFIYLFDIIKSFVENPVPFKFLVKTSTYSNLNFYFSVWSEIPLTKKNKKKESRKRKLRKGKSRVSLLNWLTNLV